MSNYLTISANEAVSKVSYKFIDVSCVYPITPSSEISEKVYKMSYDGEKNIFGQTVIVREMQSEAGSSAVLHGALTSGSLCSTFTCSQGLLLMIPEMYRICGEFLPAVIHVSSRSVAKHALSIFCDHSDVYSCLQTGWAMICSSNVQEAHDFACISHMSAIESSYPFLHFFDGFRTSHEIQKVRIVDDKFILDNVNFECIQKFRNNALSNHRSFIRGSNQNDDIYFQCCEAGNKIQAKVTSNIEIYMNKFNEYFGTSYHPFDFYGDENAEYIIVALGSICGTTEEVVDFLNSKNKKVGVTKVRVFRPFSSSHFVDLLPKTVKKVSVLDRSKTPGASGEALYLDVVSALYEHKINIEVLGGIYGLGGKNTSPSDILSVFENMFYDNSKRKFTVGIDDDVSYLSLNPSEHIETDNSISLKFFGVGSDGMVGASKNIAKMIGESSELNVQYYPQYDSKKSGGLTISHIRFSDVPIKSEYYIEKANYVICSNFSYVSKYDFTESLKNGGTFLINCKEDKLKLPCKLCEFIKENNISVYSINAKKITSELNLGNFYGIVMQGAFLKICSHLEYQDKKDLIKRFVRDFYYKKNQKLIESNLRAIDLSFDEVKKVEKIGILEENEHNYDTIDLINLNRGNNIPVSKFSEFFNGNTPCATSSKSIISSNKHPKWISENCSQCGLCSFICPHASIRSFVLDDNEIKKLGNIKHEKMFGSENKNFVISVSGKHCTGCSLCATVCPGRMGKKALEMSENSDSTEGFDFLENSKTNYKSKIVKTIRDVQFKESLMKFNSACPGCGETGYVRLISQLFGERLVISNATGCSSIWGGNASAVPYFVSKNGLNPAWQNSLFEDAAEFGFGMYLSHKSMREKILNLVEEILSLSHDDELKKLCSQYIETFNSGDENFEVSSKLVDELNKSQEKIEQIKKVLLNKEYVSKKSFWVIGGDGWAYDIGFGGLDHIMASGEDINILVLDTEIYSNTGGQASKATPEHASASFALGGKNQKKKNLSRMIMSYQTAYVAQVSMGANQNQCLKAIIEAEKFRGPSLIVAYAPCIGHGIKGGLSNSIDTQKLAVKSGHFDLFRFDPNKKELLKDSSSDENYMKEFMSHERRFDAFMKDN